MPSDTFLEYQREFADQLVLPIYHMISDSDVPYVKQLYSYRNIESFIADLDFLREHYQPAGLRDVLSAVQGGGGLAPRSFSLTFDDGFRELYDIVAPLLKAWGIPATFFINKGFVDNKQMFYRNKGSLLIEHFLSHPDSGNINHIAELFQDHDIPFEDLSSAIFSIEHPQRQILDLVAVELNLDFDAYLNKKQPYLTTGQVRSLIDDGFHVGAHSIDHPRYSAIPLKEQIAQTKVSVEYVVNTFGLDYKVFAFPFDDRWVSSQYFDKVFAENIIEVSFGASDMIDDPFPRNMQRSWFENTTLNAEELLIKNYMEKKRRMARGADRITRPFSEIRSFTVDQLNKAIDQDLFWKDEKVIPITKHRARAQTVNPRAKGTDIALLAMYHDDQIIGYLGALPDRIYINDQVLNWGWMTCWWVSPEYAGKGIGHALLNKLYELYDGYIGGSNPSQLGRKAVSKSDKLQHLNLNGTIFRFSDPDEYDADSEFERKLKVWQSNSNCLEQVRIEYVNELDETTNQFIVRNRKRELSNRDKRELNWVLRYPWILETPFDDLIKPKVFFSSLSRRFYYLAVKVHDLNDELIGFFMLRNRDDKLRVPYFYCKDDAASLQKVVEVIGHHIVEMKVTELSTCNEDVIDGLSSICIPVLKTLPHEQHYFLSDRIDLKDLEPLHIQDGDGEYVFT